MAGCGIDLSLVLDASGSISAAGAVEQVRTAARSFLTGLESTGTKSQIIQFGTQAKITAPPTLITAESLAPGGVLDQALAQYFQNGVPGGGDANPRRRLASGSTNPLLEANYLGIGTGAAGVTNWQESLEFATQGSQPKITLFLTDGDPTAVVSNGRSNTGLTPDPWPGTYLGMSQVPEGEKYAFFKGILAANDVKAAGSRVLVVGVGNDFKPDSLDRLKAVAGPTGSQTEAAVWSGPADGDFDINNFGVVRVPNFDELAPALAQVVRSLCSPSVTIQKLAETPNGYAPAPGWNMTVHPKYDPPTTFVWNLPVAGAAPGPQTAATDANGIAQFQWEPTSDATGTVEVTETLVPGWFMQGVTCQRDDLSGPSNEPPFVNGQAQFANVPFTIPVGPESIVTCTMRNGKTPEPATGSLRITKEFNPLSSGATSAFDIGYQCVQSGQIVKSGTASLKAGESAKVDGIVVGADCTISEDKLPTAPAGWSYGTPTFSPAKTVKIAKDTVTDVKVTNTISAVSPVRVACKTKVNYAKPVVNKDGKFVLVNSVKTSGDCTVVKPVVLCRATKATVAGERAICRVSTNAKGRITVKVNNPGKYRVGAVIRTKPKAGARDEYKRNTVRKTWKLKA